MIHHISIPAENPFRVAQVLCEIWNGQLAPFTAYADSYVVFALDDWGTLIEVYPLGTELLPGLGEQQVCFATNPRSPAYTATHAAISVQSARLKFRALLIEKNGVLFAVTGTAVLRSLNCG